MPSLFPLGWIVNSALATAALSTLVILLWERWFKTLASFLKVALVVAAAFLSVLVWRAVCNVGVLNDDPVPGFSPNDLLCPIFTYLVLGMLTAFQRPADVTRWERLRVILALIAFVVNVMTI
jgi:hypothetical protein